MKRTKVNKNQNSFESKYEKMYNAILSRTTVDYSIIKYEEKNSSLEQPTDLIDVQTSTVYGLCEQIKN